MLAAYKKISYYASASLFFLITIIVQLRQKKQNQDKMKHSIYETFRLKLKSLLILLK